MTPDPAYVSAALAAVRAYMVRVEGDPVDIEEFVSSLETAQQYAREELACARRAVDVRTPFEDLHRYYLQWLVEAEQLVDVVGG